jgi:hypothetical protein
MTPKLFALTDGSHGDLGKMLLPWARCEIFCRRFRVPMLAPAWMSPRIGWIFGRGNGGASSAGHFTKRGYVTGFQRLSVLLSARRVNEKDFVPGAHEAPGGGRKTVVVFSGGNGGFQPLLPHREFVRERLTEILSPRVRRLLAREKTNFVIGAHICRGEKPPREELLTRESQTIPEEWFVRCIQNLRKALGFAAPVRVFSDARAGQLRRLLALPNVSFTPGNPPIADALLMARSRILIGCAHSHLSMWSAFLGEMPSLWYPGSGPNLSPDKPYLETQTDLDGHFGDEFASVIDSLNLALNP